MNQKTKLNHNRHTVSICVEEMLPDPGQPRKTFSPDGLNNLGQSLVETGQVSPIVVRPGPQGKYMIVVGERRWRAAREAGLSHLDCVIRHDINERQAQEMQFAENYQRQDIPPLEQARSFKDYLSRYKVSQSELSRRTGIPQRTISDRLALLSLPASVHAKIEAGAIGPYEALKIATLPADEQEVVAEEVSSGRIGGRALEKLIRESSQRSNRVVQETLRPAEVAETKIGLSQRLENLEKAVYRLAGIYLFNDAARELGYRMAPPCPECLKRGDSGYPLAIKREMTPKERREWIKSIEEAEEIDDEDKEVLLEQEPPHIIEAKCRHCGYTEVIEHIRE